MRSPCAEQLSIWGRDISCGELMLSGGSTPLAGNARPGDALPLRAAGKVQGLYGCRVYSSFAPLLTVHVLHSAARCHQYCHRNTGAIEQDHGMIIDLWSKLSKTPYLAEIRTLPKRRIRIPFERTPG
jgi:hypothetical protein